MAIFFLIMKLYESVFIRITHGGNSYAYAEHTIILHKIEKTSLNYQLFVS